MKTSNIKSVQGNGTWDSPHGLLYKFEYEMENGDVGGANHKTKEPKYKVGEEVTYEVVTKGDFVNIKFHNPQENKGYPTKKDPEVQKQIIRQSSISNALKHFELNEHKPKKEEVVQLAEYFKNYVIEGLNGKAKPTADADVSGYPKNMNTSVPEDNKVETDLEKLPF